jgi:hypothetical protein
MFKEAFLIGQMLDGVIPDVYLQSAKYWERHKETIRSHFGENIGHTNAVALHIRRGDYLNNNFYADLWKTDYYKKAIALFPNEKFIVFCRDNQGWEQDKSDRQWCRDNLKPLLGDRFELPPKNNTEIDDMNLMASCKSIIMANSSFSWWAGFLGKHERVICPREWFADGVQRTEPLPEWELI